ncbi:hypothetical protein [Fimbriiglobus ruber]|nr:hypothetical protein [Fimbriiglobus ruber]
MLTKLIVGLVAVVGVAVGGFSSVAGTSLTQAAGVSCCEPGADCCFPGSPCCAEEDCCVAGSPCCESAAVARVNQTAADCCAAVEACCPTGACCASY